MKSQKFTFLATLLTGLLLSVTTGMFAAAITWTGDGDGISWEDAANWDLNMVPTNEDRVFIEGTSMVTISTPVEAFRLRLRDDAVLTIMASGQLSFNSMSNSANDLIRLRQSAKINNSGSISVTATTDQFALDCAGTTMITNGGSFIISGQTGGDAVRLTNQAKFINNGTFSVSNALEDAIDMNDNAELINNSMMEINDPNFEGISMDDASSFINNDNLMCIDGSIEMNDATFVQNLGTMTLTDECDAIELDDEARFENDGTINIQDGDCDGIDQDDDDTVFRNSGTLNIMLIAFGDNAIEVDDGEFINLPTGIINLTGLPSDGIDMQTDGRFNNQGEITIEVTNGDDSGDDGIDMECGTEFRNSGLIFIDNGDFTLGSAIEMECEDAEFRNRSCGGVFINSNSSIDVANGALFRNSGYLFSAFDGTNDNNGTFRNNGIIEDPDGFMIAPNAVVGDPMTAQDMEAPMISCPADVSVMTDCFDDLQTVTFDEPTAMDNCNVLTIESMPASDSDFMVGTTVVTSTVTDQAGNTATCTFNVIVSQPMVAAPVANTATKAFCQNEDLAVNLANTGINVSNSLSANEKVVWVLTSAPAGSAFAANDEFTVDDCGDTFKNFGELAVANSSKVIRVQDPANAPVGTYTFDAYIEDCSNGCTSELTSGFSITVNAAPSVMITADPEGDLCLGQEGVQYGADITSTDGGTYTYAWCAYNSGDGSGTCFNGFDDNTSATPSRDWTTTAGAKSVGVAVSSDVAGCEAEDLYSFEVVAPTMVECPADIMATLVTDPSTFDCATDITFNNPMVTPGPCDPVNLTIEITGPSGAGPEMVTPGEEYVFTVEELGTYTVTYNLSDAVGNTSSCSFDIIVGGLPCGWVDDGGIGECAGMNSSAFDQGAEVFSVTSNGCVPEFPHIADEQAFVYTQLCGDGSIKVFVDDISAKGIAGIQLRESVAPGSKKVEISTDRIARLFRAVRVLDDYPAFPQQILSFDKFWLKIERTGNTFRAFASVDDVNYIPYVFQTIQMEECLVAGMFTTSTNDEDVVTANFTNVEVIESGTDFLQAAPQTIAQSEKANELTIGLAPNPAKGQVTLNLDQLIGEAATISIFNINGQLMSSVQYDSVEDATQTMDISNLPAGTYYVNVKTATTQQTLKLIKQ